MKRRQLILLLGGGSAAAASTGSGAFSSVEADRAVSVNVVEDEKAYLGLEKRPGNRSYLQITNQFAKTLTLDLTARIKEHNSEFEVEVKGKDSHIEIKVKSGNGNSSGSKQVVITPGQSAPVNVEFKNGKPIKVEMEFSGTVGDSGTTVEKTDTYILKPDNPGNSDNSGKPDDPGNSDNSGKPDDPGNSDNSGKPDDPGNSDE